MRAPICAVRDFWGMLALRKTHQTAVLTQALAIGGFVAQGIGLQDAIAVIYHEILCHHDLFRGLSLNYKILPI